MGTFEYLTVFVSIILGLGMTYLILGVGKLLSQRGYYQFYWIHHLQIFTTFLLLLNSWWVTYSWVEINNLTFLHYLFLMCSPFIVVLASSLLFPSGNKQKIRNLKEYYLSICQPYYILISLFYPLDFIDTLLKGTQRVAELGGIYIVITSLSFIIVLSAAYIRKPLYHGFVQAYIIIVLLISKYLFNPTLESFIN